MANRIVKNKKVVASNPDFDCCDHVTLGTVCNSHTEVDSFGIVGGRYECDDCFKAAELVESNALDTCSYCGDEFPRRNLLEYKWWGFDYYQGDEPLQVCPGCRVGKEHRARKEKDHQAALDECGMHSNGIEDIVFAKPISESAPARPKRFRNK